MIPATIHRTIWDELPEANVDTQKLEHLFESRAKDLMTKVKKKREMGRFPLCFGENFNWEGNKTERTFIICSILAEAVFNRLHHLFIPIHDLVSTSMVAPILYRVIQHTVTLLIIKARVYHTYTWDLVLAVTVNKYHGRKDICSLNCIT